jgi:acyl phosphate:glycerol-3-phosphate acyltransferase
MTTIIIYKILVAIIAYLFGAFPTGYIIYKIKKNGDIRDAGSGNVGGTNVTRTVGIKEGVITIIVDILKGFLPLLAVFYIFKADALLAAIVAVAAVLGHIFPVYLKFRGGKGIATSFGAIVGMCAFGFSGNSLWLRLLPIFLILVTWAIVFAASRIVSLSSLAAAIATPLSFYFSKHPMPIVIAAICLFVLTFIAHRDNIIRLIRKEEKKLKGKGAKL